MSMSLAASRIAIGVLTLFCFCALANRLARGSEIPAAEASISDASTDAATLATKVAPSRPQSLQTSVAKQTIGAVAQVFEPQSRLQFMARVDTGAASCSIHCIQWQIEDEAASLEKNVGKPILILIGNHNDEAEWIASHIESCVTVKTSEREELRYKKLLTLRWQNFEKQVAVTLNDRSHMNYPLLLGRNFLEKDFVVDIDQTHETNKALAQVR